MIWRDLQPALDTLRQRFGQRLRILDIGAGLGQLSLRLAEQGHNIVVNDVSTIMLEKAQRNAQDQNTQSIQWLACPYQELITQHQFEPFHLVLCHAVLEWLAQPEQLIPSAYQLCESGGMLSLCFYNPDSMIYRNLIMGNFNWLEQHLEPHNDNKKNQNERDIKTHKPDQGSLTPAHPCNRSEVESWVKDAGFVLTYSAGLRVFHDYVVNKRGGHAIPAEVLKMELLYSQQEPFKWLGRYIHFLAHKNTN